MATAASVHATIYHDPPRADNFHYAYPTPNHFTNDAALTAATNQYAVGYDAEHWMNGPAHIAGPQMVHDAVWSIYGHANSQLMLCYELGQHTDLTKGMIAEYDLSGMRLAAFYGCNTAQGTDHITSRAVASGSGAAIGFYGQVLLGSHATTGPANTWSWFFWNAMRSGNTVNAAAAYAKDQYYAARGQYEGVDTWSTWGNGGQKITPAGYK